MNWIKLLEIITRDFIGKSMSFNSLRFFQSVKKKFCRKVTKVLKLGRNERWKGALSSKSKGGNEFIAFSSLEMLRLKLKINDRVLFFPNHKR